MTPAKLNYPIYDKELLAIVAAFHEWRHLLLSSSRPITVFTDHNNLNYWTTARLLNRRQVRWSLFLADFSFYIQYRPGSQQIISDSLSRRADHMLQEGDNAPLSILSPMQLINVMDADRLDQDDDGEDSNLELTPDEKREGVEDSLLTRIRKGLKADNFAKLIKATPNEFREDELLYVNGLIYVPVRVS